MVNNYEEDHGANIKMPCGHFVSNSMVNVLTLHYIEKNSVEIGISKLTLHQSLSQFLTHKTNKSISALIRA